MERFVLVFAALITGCLLSASGVRVTGQAETSNYNNHLGFNCEGDVAGVCFISDGNYSITSGQHWNWVASGTDVIDVNAGRKCDSDNKKVERWFEKGLSSDNIAATVDNTGWGMPVPGTLYFALSGTLVVWFNDNTVNSYPIRLAKGCYSLTGHDQWWFGGENLIVSDRSTLQAKDQNVWIHGEANGDTITVTTESPCSKLHNNHVSFVTGDEEDIANVAFCWDGSYSITENQPFEGVATESNSTYDIKAGRICSTSVADWFNDGLTDANMLSTYGPGIPSSGIPLGLEFAIKGTLNISFKDDTPPLNIPIRLAQGIVGTNPNLWIAGADLTQQNGNQLRVNNTNVVLTVITFNEISVDEF